jgi:hypothetical protein
VPFHTVQQGETLLGLASQNGLESWEDIVNAPENASIKDTLADPGVVKPGISLFLPNKTMKQQPSAVDAKHPFTVKRPKAWIRLAIKDADGAALANCKYELTVAGKTTSGTIAAGGVIEQAVPIDTTSGVLKVWTSDSAFEEWQLKIGWMDPISEDSGIQARLANLGFDFGDDLPSAVKAFQARVGIEATGTIDDTLRQKLATYYDPAQDESTQDVAPADDESEAAEA